MLEVVESWFGDEDLVVFLNRHFTYQTPHHYIEYADSNNAPQSIYLKRHDQETDSEIFYSFDFRPNDPLIKFIVIKAMETIAELTGCDPLSLQSERVHLTVQHPGQDIGEHQDHGDITAVYTAAAPGGGDFVFDTDQGTRSVPFRDNTLFVFDGKQRHRALAPQARRPRVLLVMKFRRTRPEGW